MTLSAKDSMARTTFIIIGISASGKFLGLVRESVLAACFGAGVESDAYKLAVDIPMILLWAITASIATTFIPVYSEFLRNRTEEKTQHFINNIFNMVILGSFILTVTGIFLSPVLVKLIAPGFDQQALSLAIRLTRVILLPLVFLALFNLGSVYLQTNGNFIVPALSWIVYNMIIIASMVLFSGAGIEAINAGTVIAVMGLFAVQIPSIVKSGYRFRLLLDFKEEGLRKISSLTIPVLFSSLFSQFYLLINRMLASGLDQGSISAMDYANKIYNTVFTVFILSIITVIYPNLSLLSDKVDVFKQSLVKGMKMIILISIPTTVGFFVLRTAIVSVLFERGAFNPYDTLVTSSALAGFSAGMLGVGLCELFNRSFYSIKDTKTPMIIGIITVFINVLLNILFVKLWGVGGLAFGTSVAGTLNGIMLFVKLRRKVGNMEGREVLAVTFKTIIASAVMGITVLLLNSFLSEHVFIGTLLVLKLIRLAIDMAAGLIIYTAVLSILKVEEVNAVILRLKNKSISVFTT